MAWQNECGISQRRQLHDSDAVRKERRALRGDCKREPRLPAAAGSDESHETNVRAKDEVRVGRAPPHRGRPAM